MVLGQNVADRFADRRDGRLGAAAPFRLSGDAWTPWLLPATPVSNISVIVM
jgi:hypothetical protein